MEVRSCTSSTKKSPATGGIVLIIALIIAAGLVLGFANLTVMTTIVHRTGDLRSLRQLFNVFPEWILYFAVTPSILAILVSFVVTRHALPTDTIAESRPQPAAPPPAPSPVPALRLLTLLQQEGRFIDFLQEDIGGYSDAQVGAAVRAIHAGCRKVLNERIELRRVLTAADGSEVTIEVGFDPAAIRLTGNVTGSPPFRGIVQHGGWRVTNMALPEFSEDTDISVLVPAEVEIQ